MGFGICLEHRGDVLSRLIMRTTWVLYAVRRGMSMCAATCETGTSFIVRGGVVFLKGGWA